MRVVLDTNVIVSALSHGGKPREILALTRKGEIELIISPFILDELSHVLKRKFLWSPERTQEAVANLLLYATVADSIPTLAVVDDDADNRVLECALAGGASIIVTGDHDLLRLNEFRKIQILKPSEFLEFLKGGSSITL